VKDEENMVVIKPLHYKISAECFTYALEVQRQRGKLEPDERNALKRKRNQATEEHDQGGPGDSRLLDLEGCIYWLLKQLSLLPLHNSFLQPFLTSCVDKSDASHLNASLSAWSALVTLLSYLVALVLEALTWSKSNSRRSRGRQRSPPRSRPFHLPFRVYIWHVA
jgi:hypothetical protein